MPGAGQNGPLAAAGQDERAVAVARLIADYGWQAQALASVAGALAAAGQHERATAVAAQAEVLARSTIDRKRQAQALAGIAEALARTGDVRTGRKVAAAACAVGEWTTPLKSVLLLSPSVIPLIKVFQAG